MLDSQSFLVFVRFIWAADSTTARLKVGPEMCDCVASPNLALALKLKSEGRAMGLTHTTQLVWPESCINMDRIISLEVGILTYGDLSSTGSTHLSNKRIKIFVRINRC